MLRKFVAALVAAGLALTCFVTPFTSVAVAATGDVRHLHAILRVDAKGKWYIQNDSDHAPYGIDLYLEQTSTYIRIFTCCVAVFRKAGTIQVSADDDFGGIIEGHANLGLNNATIFIYADTDGDGTKERIDPAHINNYVAGVGNFWINIVMIE